MKDNLLIIESYIWEPHISRVYKIAKKEKNNFEVKVVLIYCNDFYELQKNIKTINFFYRLKKILLITKLCLQLKLIGVNTKIIFLRNQKKYFDQAKILIKNVNRLHDLKDISYRNIKIGCGVMSSTISRFRTSDLYVSEIQSEIIVNLHNALNYLNFLEKLVRDNRINRLVTYSGRFNISYVTTQVAERNEIPIYFHECTRNYDRYYYSEKKIHSFQDQNKLISEFWETSKLPLNERMVIAKDFYENCRYGRVGPSGINRSFTKNQKNGLIPKRGEKKRLTFYGNSEDEYAIFELESDESFEWRSQFEAVYTLKKVIDEIEEIELIIRVHPNDKDLRWYQFGNELNIIGADSRVDTYALLDSSDIVISYRTSIGIEALYWGKPSIMMANSDFSSLENIDLVKNKTQLKEVINLHVSNSFQIKENKRYPAIQVGYFRNQFGY